MKVKRPSRAVDAADWHQHMERRLRAEFIIGVDEAWRMRTGRPMTAAELEHVIRRYLGTCDETEVRSVAGPTRGAGET
jgi:hypothetical protein